MPPAYGLDFDLIPDPRRLTLTPEEGWCVVQGAGVPWALWVRRGEAADGRLVITGLAVLGPEVDGQEQPFEVTSSDLREVSPVQIAHALDAVVRPRHRPDAALTGAIWDQWSADLERGTAPVMDDDLRAFAAEYARQLQVDPVHAVANAAHALHISRNTGYRRLKDLKSLQRERRGGDMGGVQFPGAAVTPIPDDGEAVIALWLETVRTGNPYAEHAVAQRFGVPVRTASQWLYALARARRLLPGEAGLPSTLARRYIDDLRLQGHLPAETDHPAGEDADDTSA